MTTKGWINAGKLHLGDHILRLDSTTARVTNLHVVAGEEDMWDLTVSNVHTFAVGDGQWVVHNTNCNNVAKNAATSLFQRARQEVGRANLNNVTIGVAKTVEGSWLASVNQGVATSSEALTDTVGLGIKKIVESRGAIYVGPTELAPPGTPINQLLHAEDYLLAEGENYEGLNGIGSATRDICNRCRQKILELYPDLLENLR